MRPLPATIAEVTPVWLTAALAQTPAWDGARIIALTSRPLGGAASLASAVYHVHVEIETRDVAVRKRQLLVKLHTPDDSRRDDAGYAAEAYFYTALASRAGVPAPTTYLALYDAHARQLIIVQEFLADGNIGTADSLLSRADLERVLGSLSALHATWWHAPEFSQLRTVRPFTAVTSGAIASLSSGALDVRLFLKRFGAFVHPTLHPYYASMSDWLPRIATGLASHATLVHLDCSAKNVFIPHDTNRAPLLFDWALFRAGPAALDLATLLCYSAGPAEHRQLPELARHYHDLLMSQGVRGYAFDALWHDFRLACLWRMVAPIHNAMYATAARDAHTRIIAPRVSSAVLACQALDEV